MQTFVDALRRIVLNPSIKRRIVDTYPAFGHHFLKVAADAVTSVPADAEQDDLGRKPRRLNTDIGERRSRKPVC
jgi:hypothetical protein